MVLPASLPPHSAPNGISPPRRSSYWFLHTHTHTHTPHAPYLSVPGPRSHEAPGVVAGEEAGGPGSARRPAALPSVGEHPGRGSPLPRPPPPPRPGAQGRVLPVSRGRVALFPEASRLFQQRGQRFLGGRAMQLILRRRLLPLGQRPGHRADHHVPPRASPQQRRQPPPPQRRPPPRRHLLPQLLPPRPAAPSGGRRPPRSPPLTSPPVTPTQPPTRDTGTPPRGTAGHRRGGAERGGAGWRLVWWGGRGARLTGSGRVLGFFSRNCSPRGLPKQAHAKPSRQRRRELCVC